MFIYTFQTIFISLILIILIHYLYNFFKDTLTTPKTKDLVNSSQYQEIIDIIKNKEYIQTIPNILNNHNNPIANTNTNTNTNSNISSSTPIDSLTNTKTDINKNEMKNELKNFLKQINSESKEISINNNNNQSPLETNPFSSNAYSSYMESI